MKIEVLISAMHLEDASIVETTRCKTDVLIINQTDKEDYYEATDAFRVRMISTTERGLANSRNMAIKNACGDICLICDDDEELVDNYNEIIEKAFKEIPTADIIAFDVVKSESSSSANRYHRILNYGRGKKIQKAPLFKTYGSWQLAFRRDSILKKNLYFDSRFGSGSGVISAGEETVWQVQAKKRGLKIYHVPIVIASIKQEQSQWFKGLNEKYYYDLGACLGKNYPIACSLLKYYYVFFIQGSSLSCLDQIKWLRKGITVFKKQGLSYEDYCRSLK